jgi:hypothetical protein
LERHSWGYKFGTAASGIPLLAGMLTIEELQRGVIDHIVGVGIPEPLAGRWSFPAQRTDGESSGKFSIPEGAIFRLPADLNLDTITIPPRPDDRQSCPEARNDRERQIGRRRLRGPKSC